jgi:hypothetical protein
MVSLGIYECGKDLTGMFESLKGKILVSIQVTRDDYVQDDEIVFTCNDGNRYRMWHMQDCCESVDIEDITGDLNDLLWSPITLAEVVSNEDPNADESGTWTFYKLATVKGYVTIRWYGASNGYYSEDVEFTHIGNLLETS